MRIFLCDPCHRRLHREGEDATKEFMDNVLCNTKMYVYFGYGSNMSPEGMASKGLTPLNNFRAILKGYRLAFNLAVPSSLVDPSYANIVPSEGDEVHGIAIVFDEKDIIALDKVSTPCLAPVNGQCCICALTRWLGGSVRP